MKDIKSHTVSNLIKGAGSILNLFPVRRKPRGLVRRFYKPHASAYEAMTADWEKTSKDFHNAWPGK